jgi:hypothetical protein
MLTHNTFTIIGGSGILFLIYNTLIKKINFLSIIYKLVL